MNLIKLYLTSPIPPSVNHYLSYRAVIRNGRPLAVSYVTQDAVKYRAEFSDYVRNEVALQGWDLVPNKEQQFYVDTVFYFEKKQQDCNNYFKVMLDAITDTQLIWLDDDVVCERVQRIYYDSKNPRIEIVIHPAPYTGIFDSVAQLNDFVSNCIGCTRYSRNCSILRKAKESRIQPEIKDGQCAKYRAISKNKAKSKRPHVDGNYKS